jgi:bifunctional non-homologous end joining protein LigD
VAAPLSWAEVEKGVRSDAFTVITLPERLARQRRDPWADLADCRQTLPAAVMRALR